MSASNPHSFNPDELDAMRALLLAARDPSRSSSSGARSSVLKQSGGGQIPEGWEAQIVEAQAKRKRRGGQRSGIASLPVAQPNALVEAQEPAQLRLCALPTCRQPLPADVPHNRKYHISCQIERQREYKRRRDAELRAARPEWCRKRKKAG